MTFRAKMAKSDLQRYPSQWEAFGYFYLKLNVFLSIIQLSLNLRICLFYTFSFKTYMLTKKYLWKKAKNFCIRGKIVIESRIFLKYWQKPLNPRALKAFSDKVFISYLIVFINCLFKFFVWSVSWNYAYSPFKFISFLLIFSLKIKICPSVIKVNVFKIVYYKNLLFSR